MQLCKVQKDTGEVRVGVITEGHVGFVNLKNHLGIETLSDILHSSNPLAVASELMNDPAAKVSLEKVKLLPPIDRQEVWAAGVTYKRSREARERESVGAARFYDLVYTAARPELFFKATPNRVVGPHGRVRVRQDSQWSVPEPELALVLSPRLEIVGYTIGNDMSARDIEGENPLYLPQAKVYSQCCALGPVITLPSAMPPLDQVTIGLSIDRGGEQVFKGLTCLSEMARSLDDLISWLGRENAFPNGIILLTGTGIVPPDNFSLAPDDVVKIEISGIGLLTNIVEKNR